MTNDFFTAEILDYIKKLRLNGCHDFSIAGSVDKGTLSYFKPGYKQAKLLMFTFMKLNDTRVSFLIEMFPFIIDNRD